MISYLPIPVTSAFTDKVKADPRFKVGNTNEVSLMKWFHDGMHE